MQNHHPEITQRPDRAWVVECAQCQNDPTAAVPIGIGMPLLDRETAQRLRDNHAARSGAGRRALGPFRWTPQRAPVTALPAP